MSGALLALTLLAIQVPGAGEERLVRARFRLAGPLSQATLTLGRLGTTELTAGLLPGESTEVVLPLPGRPLDGQPPRIVVRPESGSVTFLGWEDPARWPAALSRLSRRTRPPVGQSVSHAGWPALALLGAAALLVVAARRRPRWALGLGLTAAVGVAAAQGAARDPSPPRTRVLEADVAPGNDGGDWLLVEGAAGSLECAPQRTLSLRCSPPAAPLEWRVALQRDGERWEAWLPGGRLWRLDPLDPGMRRLRAEANTWGTLQRAFTRSASGIWTDRGSWRLGDPLPAPAPGRGAAPPGWLASGLPQGREVLVGLLLAGAFSGGQDAPQSVWVRLVGFETSAGH